MTSPFSRAASAYASVGLESRAAGSGSHELVIMLFEGLLERISLAKVAIEARDVAGKVKRIDKALQILNEGLRTHLDVKSGGELAQNLDALYEYCSMRLVQANARNDVAALSEVYGLIEPILEAWKQMRPGSVGSGASVEPPDSLAPRAASASTPGSDKKFFSGFGGFSNHLMAGV